MSYNTDVYEWTKEQADALRRGAANELDWDNLAEETFALPHADRVYVLERGRMVWAGGPGQFAREAGAQYL